MVVVPSAAFADDARDAQQMPNLVQGLGGAFCLLMA
jgi:hypothetical protein